MKRGLEELKNLDKELVASRAHIIQSVLDDIINKRFDKINPVKAKGLIKILEREFDLDLSDWVSEFEESQKDKKPQLTTIDKINVEAVSNNKKPISKAALALFVLAAALGGGYILYLQQNSVSSEANVSVSSLQNEIKQTNENASLNMSFNTNTNATVATPQTLPEQNTTAPKPKTEAIAKDVFYAEPSARVWVGIKYLDNETNSWHENTTAEKIEFNASRKQVIAFGHSMVKVVAGEFTAAPKEGGKIRYLYENGKLTEIGEGEYNKLLGKKKAKKESATVEEKQQ